MLTHHAASDSPTKDPINLKTAPSGSRGRWPLRYTCDMANGFRLMEMQSSPEMSTQQKFMAAFEVPWKPSTYSDNLHIWNTVPPKVMEEAVSRGRTIRGNGQS
jgi:hypothetical protein